MDPLLSDRGLGVLFRREPVLGGQAGESAAQLGGAERGVERRRFLIFMSTTTACVLMVVVFLAFAFLWREQ